RRSHLRLRLPDVHHRRRHPARDPAHGHHAAPRLVRGLEHHRELPGARRPHARLEPRERRARGRAVNRQLNRLAVVTVVLLVVLVAATTYWQTWATAGLQDKQDNAIERVVQFTVARGSIQANGATFAANVR